MWNFGLEDIELKCADGCSRNCEIKGNFYNDAFSESTRLDVGYPDPKTPVILLCDEEFLVPPTPEELNEEV